VIAEGPPDALKAQIGGSQVDLVLAAADELPAAAVILERVAGAEPVLDAGARRLTAPLAEPVAGLTELLRELEHAEIAAEDVALRRPTLDEVFMRLTGEEVAA
jgi:ABC-2 type transport system ATP-binding protein